MAPNIVQRHLEVNGVLGSGFMFLVIRQIFQFTRNPQTLVGVIASYLFGDLFLRVAGEPQVERP